MNQLNRTAAVAILLIAPLAAAQNAVTDWNSTAITAARASTVAPGSPTPGGASVYIAYMQLAVYNAVNSINQRFEPYKYSLTAPAGASAEAAAVEAAYRTLQYLFPDQSALLDAQYNLSLSAIPDGPAKTNGQTLGQASAIALIALRANDGRGANVPYTYPSTPVPGVWILTPGATTPQTPWLGQMRPFTFDNPAQFLPEPPPDLGSKTWINDFNEVKMLGALNSTVRTPQQTEIALFWTDHTTAQYGRLLRAIAADRKLSLMDTARLFAMAYATEADTVIVTYNAKYHFSFWRPVTSIQNADIDGNPDTISDPTWLPLVTTPPHPEYPSAHASLTAALANTLKVYFHNPNLHLTIDSTATNTIHTFNNVRDWAKEVENARIYVGFHYPNSVVQGSALGRRVSNNVVRNYFRPVN